MKILEEQRPIYYRLAGVFLGLAIVTKYPALIFGFTIIFTHLIIHNYQFKDWQKLRITATACLASAFVAAPFLFLDFSRALRHIKGEARSQNVGATGEGLLSNLIWYWDYALKDSLTIWGLIFLVIGLILCIVSPRKSSYILVFFPLIFYLFIASLSLRWERWIIPLIPFACLLIAYSIFFLAQNLEKFSKLPISLVVVSACLWLILTPLMARNQTEFHELTGLNTGTIAREWVMTNLPPNSSILVDEGAPPLPIEGFKLFEVDKGDVVPIKPDKMRHAFIGVELNPIGKLQDIEAVYQEGIDYIIVGWKYLQYLQERDNYPEIVKTYEQLLANSELIYKVERNEEITSGTKIQVYKVLKN